MFSSLQATMVCAPTISFTDHSINSILGVKQGSNANSPASTNSTRRKRRHRTMFPERTIDSLDAIFLTNPYPDIIAREHIASQHSLTESRVQVWFQNKRSRHRRHSYQKGRPEVNNQIHTVKPINVEDDKVTPTARVPPQPRDVNYTTQPSQPDLKKQDDIYRQYQQSPFMYMSSSFYMDPMFLYNRVLQPTNLRANVTLSGNKISSDCHTGGSYPSTNPYTYAPMHVFSGVTSPRSVSTA